MADLTPPVKRQIIALASDEFAALVELARPDPQVGDKKFLARRVELRVDSAQKVQVLCTDACGFYLEMVDHKECLISLTIPGSEDEVHVTIKSPGNLSVTTKEA